MHRLAAYVCCTKLIHLFNILVHHIIYRNRTLNDHVWIKMHIRLIKHLLNIILTIKMGYRSFHSKWTFCKSITANCKSITVNMWYGVCIIVVLIWFWDPFSIFSLELFLLHLQLIKFVEGHHAFYKLVWPELWRHLLNLS